MENQNKAYQTVKAIDYLINELKFIKVSEKHNEKLWATIEKARELEKQNKIELLKHIDAQLSELQKQSTKPNNLTIGDKRGGEYRIGLSKAKDCLNDNIYLIQIDAI